jgi:alpha-glucuronidase
MQLPVDFSDEAEPGVTEVSIEQAFTPGVEGAYRLALSGDSSLKITAGSELGILYGVFALLKELQQGRTPSEVHSQATPRLRLRMLNHWDNLDRSIERGYAGQSLWD